jgi:hypothetical protein
MTQTKQSWTRTSAVSSIACVVAGVAWGIIHCATLSSWEEETLGTLFIVACVGICLFLAWVALHEESRVRIIILLLVCVLLGSFFIYLLSGFIGPSRAAICAAFSSVVSELNNLPPEKNVEK